jgi:hypothetical protein
MKTKTSILLKGLKGNTNNFLSQLVQTTRDIQDSYDEDMNIVKKDLLIKIANDYSLDYGELEYRYLNKKKQKSKKSNGDLNADDSEYIPKNINDKTDQLLLYKTSYMDKDYYIELVECGNVYDDKNNIVGIWQNGEMELNMELIEQLRIINEHIQNCSNNEKLDEDLEDSEDFCKIIKKEGKDGKDKMSEFIDDFIKTTTNQVDNQIVPKKKVGRKKKEVESVDI